MSSASSDSSDTEERFLAAVSSSAHKRRLSSSDEANDHFSPNRSSGRLRDKRRHALTLPTRKKVWDSISSNASSKSYRHLKPRKLVTEWIKERNYYNRDRERASDEEASLEDFIDDTSSEDSCEPRKTRLKNKRYKRVLSSASSSECDSAIDDPKTADVRHGKLSCERLEANADQLHYQITANMSKDSALDELQCEDEISTPELNKGTQSVCYDPCIANSNAFHNSDNKIGNSECLTRVRGSDRCGDDSDDEDIVKGVTPLSGKHYISSDDESSNSITSDIVKENASLSGNHCIISDDESSNSVTLDVVEVNTSDVHKGHYIASGKHCIATDDSVISDNESDSARSTSTSDSASSDDADARTSRQSKLRKKLVESRRRSMLTELITARERKLSKDKS